MNTQSFFIKRKLFYIIKYIYIAILCSQCKYQFPINTIQNNNDILHNTQIMVILYSYEPFNTITRAIRKELNLNKINIINSPNNHSLPRISLGNSTPRPPLMRGGTCPLLPLKMQGESFADPFVLVTIIICRASLHGAQPD